MLTYPHFGPAFPYGQWSLKNVLAHQADAQGDRPFLKWGESGEQYSFRETNRLTNRLARGFQKTGIAKGDAVVIFMPNCLDYILCWFGLNTIGAIEAPINIAFKHRLLEHQVNTCKAKAIVVDSSLLQVVLNSIDQMPTVRSIIVRFDSTIEGEELDSTTFGQNGKIIVLSELFDVATSDPGVDVAPHDLAAIMFTSGTTGPSKGVMMPHAQTYLFAQIGAKAMELEHTDVYVTMLPLFHANAQFLTVFPALIAGAQCVVFDRFRSSKWLERIRTSGATVTNALGVMLPFICDQPRTEQDRDHALRAVFAGGNPPHVVAQFSAKFGVDKFCDAFGQTEICLPILTPLANNDAHPVGSAGLLLVQWFDARIVYPLTDEEVPVGEVGELIIRHKVPWTINAGYAGVAEKNMEAWRNLWFHTGDALRRDANGWFFFVDRMKDTIRRRGENISSFEVELAILEHPAIAEAAVVAVPANDGGGEDEVKACVVLIAGASADHQDIVNWCVDRLPAFAVPRYVEFKPSLPKTPTEKVKKTDLRAEGVTEGTWDRMVAAAAPPTQRASRSTPA
jgi:crotonobetaine/carnitine-CoA ligase